MGNFDVISYILGNSYTDEEVKGGGAIKGSPCYIKSKEAITGGTRVTFGWTLSDYTERTQTVDIMNGKDGQDGEDGKDGSQVSVTQVQKTGKKIAELTIDGVKTILYAPNDGGGGGSAELSDDLTTAISVGGIDSGVTYEAGTPLETIIRDLLEPTLYPSFTNPSASLSATGAKLLEKGSTLATTFTIVFNRGSINPQYSAESAYRSGVATSYTLSGNTQSSNTFSETVSEAKTSYQGSVAYAQGVQPKDSKGNNYNSPLPSGSVNTNTITYEFVNALYANVSDITTVAKQALVSKSAKVKEFTFPAQTVANPEEFHVDSTWTITAVEVLNTLSNQWESCAGEFTVTDTTHTDAGGATVNYKKYLCNLGVATGSRKIRIKWS